MTRKRENHAQKSPKGDRRPRPSRRWVAVLPLALTVAAFVLGSVAPAQAALIHEFDSYFGGGSLAQPESLAVDQVSGDVYVLEHGSGCVARFFGDRGGPGALTPHVFAATGTNKVCGLELRDSPSNAQIAVDNSNTSTQGTFYVNSPMHEEGYGVTLGFDPEGHQVTELRPLHSDFGAYYVCGVTTDAAGNVYVGEHYGGRQKYRNDDPVTEADYESGVEEGPACGIAQDSQGKGYASWESDGPLIHNNVVLRETSYAITVDQSSDDLYVSEGSVVTGISSDGVAFDEFGAGDFSQARGVAVDEANDIAYVSDTPNGRIAVFQGSTAYRVDVDLGGTGLGAVSADAAPVEACGDEGQCAGYYAPSTLVLTATPQPHSKIEGWTGCDAISPAGDKCTLDITDHNRSVFTTFTRLQRPVTAAIAGTGSGSVSSANPQGAIQECGNGGTCSGAYDEGSAVKLIATPSGHSSFSGWSGACTNQSGPCEVVVEGTPTATANFTIQRPLSVRKTGTGAGSVLSEPNGLDCGGVCVGYFTDGETVTLSAVSSGHSTFAGWSGEGCSGTGTCQLEVGADTGGVTATFSHEAPTAVTLAGATFVGQRVATVSGLVNANGAQVTNCVIEYGVTTAYGSQAACAPSTVGNGDAQIPIGANLGGLLPGTTYHYRVSATNSGGTAVGADQAFRTLDDSCDSNAALCPPAERPEAETETVTKHCKKGFALKRGHCVKKKKTHRKAKSHSQRGQGR